jgi:hypothetical protein
MIPVNVDVMVGTSAAYSRDSGSWADVRCFCSFDSFVNPSIRIPGHYLKIGCDRFHIVFHSDIYERYLTSAVDAALYNRRLFWEVGWNMEQSSTVVGVLCFALVGYLTALHPFHMLFSVE